MKKPPCPVFGGIICDFAHLNVVSGEDKIHSFRNCFFMHRGNVQTALVFQNESINELIDVLQNEYIGV
eukprot:CAMPEP_0116542292 /NCGR_PEP_ID=MMETSP0397-20121206/938_1 /TAXON_ID=216820 /ORGANISM="Cyclophora tenuis, Strain ECT3854" /LENGTH=67 /DNA_ID=CAMNT_0004066291 /DNA_START=560 /DNA_END=763 /DNA_ORIENTATION=+